MGGDFRGQSDGANAEAFELRLSVLQLVLGVVELLLQRLRDLGDVAALQPGGSGDELVDKGGHDIGRTLRVVPLEDDAEQVALVRERDRQVLLQTDCGFTRRDEREFHSASRGQCGSRRLPAQAELPSEGIAEHSGL